MLLQKLKQSSSQIKESNSFEALSSKRDKLKRLDEHISKLNNKVNKYAGMKKLLITYLGENEDICFKQLIRVNNDLAVIIKNIEKEELSDYRWINDIESVVSEHEEKLKDYWKSKYTLKVANTLSILGLLEKIYILDDRRFKILEVKSKISRLGNSWPFSENEIKVMDEGIEEANKIITKLHVSRNVQEFLQKASIGEATILDLNDEILSWIKEHGFSERVKLSFI